MRSYCCARPKGLTCHHRPLKDTPVLMITDPRQSGKTTVVRDLVGGIANSSRGWIFSSGTFAGIVPASERAAKRGPVFITDRGRPSHVLLTAEEYQRITGGQKSIADLLAMPEAAEIEFEPPRLAGHLHEPADLS